MALTPEPNGATGISTANGGTGNSNGPGNLNGPPFNADLPVEAGETYALVVMNWTNSLEGYAIDFGQSTASLYDEASPSIDSVEVMNCENTALRVFLSEFVDDATVTVEDFNLQVRWIGARIFHGNGCQSDQWIQPYLSDG